MDSDHEDRFVVFALQEPVSWDDDLPAPAEPEDLEQEVASCASYQEACRVRRRYLAVSRPCVIRYVGPTGGGD